MPSGSVGVVTSPGRHGVRAVLVEVDRDARQTVFVRVPDAILIHVVVDRAADLARRGVAAEVHAGELGADEQRDAVEHLRRRGANCVIAPRGNHHHERLRRYGGRRGLTATSSGSVSVSRKFGVPSSPNA